MDNTIESLQIKIEGARELLTEKSRDAIDSISWKLIIDGMKEKYNPEQLENLKTETELLLCGLLNAKEYENEIENRLLISKDGVVSLLNDMDNLVFKKIQEALEKRLENKTIIITQEKKPLVFNQRFVKMPDDVQTAIAQSGWKERLYEIASKYKLSIEQMGILEELTIKVISDEILPNKYEEELTSKITIPKEDISTLVRDVNENILKKIRELMKKEEETGVLKKEELAEDIPIPPYGKVINNYELKITNRGEETTKPIILEPAEEKDQAKESSINYGVGIKNEEKIIEIPTISKEEILPFKVGAEMPKETEIPKPPQITPGLFNVPKNIIEEKLKGSTTSDHSVSDYSTPKINTPSTTPHDPYREAF